MSESSIITLQYSVTSNIFFYATASLIFLIQSLFVKRPLLDSFKLSILSFYSFLLTQQWHCFSFLWVWLGRGGVITKMSMSELWRKIKQQKLLYCWKKTTATKLHLLFIFCALQMEIKQSGQHFLFWFLLQIYSWRLVIVAVTICTFFLKQLNFWNFNL